MNNEDLLLLKRQGTGGLVHKINGSCIGMIQILS